MTASTSSSGTPSGGSRETFAPLPDRDAWRALGAMLIGFFMILVDQTIVAVASEAFNRQMGASENQIIWVTSAYLLAFVVPLLFTGRLGDQIGPKNATIAGLVVFTVSSLWCGLAGSMNELIAARVLQGFGAALISPQSLAVITRVFAPKSRGAAMGVWGAVAGIASMVGPIAGGLLVDSVGWEWVFFINVPIGVLGVFAVARFVPRLPTSAHRYDYLGIVLSALGMFLLVYGIQQGAAHDWSPGIIGMILAGVVVLALFLAWQGLNRAEPLVPLRLFRNRNFSVGNAAISSMGFVVAGTMVPLMMFLQLVMGLSAIQSGLVLVPMATVSGGCAPFVGRLADRVDPRFLTAVGYGSMSLACLWLVVVMHADTTVWQLMGPMVLLGIGNGFVWAPTSTTSMRTLDVRLAGAGSGVYNTTRQVGAVIGSAAIGALMQTRTSAAVASGTPMPEALATGMSEAFILPAVVILLGGAATMLFRTPQFRRGAVREIDVVGDS